jgi:hypothetical protein
MRIESTRETPDRKRFARRHAGNDLASSFDLREMSFGIKASTQAGGCQRPDRRQPSPHQRQRGQRLD